MRYQLYRDVSADCLRALLFIYVYEPKCHWFPCIFVEISELVRFASIREYSHSSQDLTIINKTVFMTSLYRKKMKLIQVLW